MINRSLVLHATLFYATLPPWIDCGTIQAWLVLFESSASRPDMNCPIELDPVVFR